MIQMGQILKTTEAVAILKAIHLPGKQMMQSDRNLGFLISSCLHILGEKKNNVSSSFNNK